MRRAVAYFHIATLGHHAEVTAEMFARFSACGLLDRVEELRVGVVGDGEVAVPDHPKVRVLFRHPDVQQFEFPTLEALYTAAVADTEPADLLYVHTKGVSVADWAVDPATDWRRYMSHFVIDRHLECFNSLNAADACGVDLREQPRPHFAGNFWWARSEYIRTLPPAESMRRADFVDARFNAEFWVGSGPGSRLASLFESDIAIHERYSCRLPERLYLGRTQLPASFRAWKAVKRTLRPHYRSLVRSPAIRARQFALMRLPISSKRIGPPKGVVRAKAYAEKVGTGMAEYRAVHDPHEGLLSRAETIHDSLDMAFDRTELAFPESFTLALAGGRAWGVDGAVITPDDRLVDEPSQYFPNQERLPGRHPIFSKYKLGPVKHVPGSVALLSTLGSDYYSHWLLDLFPRIRLLQLAGYQLTAFDRILMPMPVQPYQQRVLASVGIDPAKVLDVSAHQHVQADNLVVPLPVGGVFGGPRWAFDFVRNTLLPDPPRGPANRRIYLSRSQTNHRHVLNEREIAEALAPLGFEVVRPELLPVEEQAKLFASAEVIVTPLGSAMANLVFCRPGTRVVEFFSPRCVQGCTWLLCGQLELKYHYIVGDSGKSDAVGIGDDILLPVALLLATLGKILRASSAV